MIFRIPEVIVQEAVLASSICDKKKGDSKKKKKKMKNCKTCAYHHEVEKVKPFPGGAVCTFLDGYVCTARIDFDGKVEWRVEVDDNEYCCDNYIPKKEKERTDPIIGG